MYIVLKPPPHHRPSSRALYLPHAIASAISSSRRAVNGRHNGKPAVLNLTSSHARAVNGRKAKSPRPQSSEGSHIHLLSRRQWKRDLQTRSPRNVDGRSVTSSRASPFSVTIPCSRTLHGRQFGRRCQAESLLADGIAASIRALCCSHARGSRPRSFVSHRGRNPSCCVHDSRPHPPTAIGDPIHALCPIRAPPSAPSSKHMFRRSPRPPNPSHHYPPLFIVLQTPMPPPSPQRRCSLPNDVTLLSSLNPIPYGVRRPTPLEIPDLVRGGRAIGVVVRGGRGDGGVLRASMMASSLCSTMWRSHRVSLEAGHRGRSSSRTPPQSPAFPAILSPEVLANMPRRGMLPSRWL
jgi:hypothetical protein